MARPLTYLPAYENGSITPVRVRDIELIKIENGVMSAITGRGTVKIKLFRSLDQLLGRVEEGVFFRANRSTLVRIERVLRVVSYSGNVHAALMAGGTEVRLSKRRLDGLMRFYGWK